MVRLACFDLPHFALQLLARKRPEWREEPFCLVSEERPQGTVLSVSRHARELGVLPGMRYAAALAVAPRLRAGAVEAPEIRSANAECDAFLYEFSPAVERREELAGVFWLDARGLDSLWGGPEAWARALQERAREHGFRARVAVGFDRFGTFAAARTSRRVVISRSAEEELAHAMRSSVSLLPLEPRAMERLGRLGVRTVAEFCALPEASVARKLGARAATLRQFAAGGDAIPPQGAEPGADPVRRREIPSLTGAESLLPYFEEMLGEVVAELTAAGTATAWVALALHLENGEELRHHITPAEPTTDRRFIRKLIDLKLQSVEIGAPVVKVELSGHGAEQRAHAGELFALPRARSLRDAARALSLLRAELGDNALVRIDLRSDHRPEDRFSLRKAVDLRSDGSLLVAGERGECASSFPGAREDAESSISTSRPSMSRGTGVDVPGPLVGGGPESGGPGIGGGPGAGERLVASEGPDVGGGPGVSEGPESGEPESERPGAGERLVASEGPAVGEGPESGRVRGRRPGVTSPLVRRILLDPVELSSKATGVVDSVFRAARAGQSPEGSCASAMLLERAGPFVLSGRWWRDEPRRAYWYIALPDGTVRWVFREGDRWFLHGAVD